MTIVEFVGMALLGVVMLLVAYLDFIRYLERFPTNSPRRGISGRELRPPVDDAIDSSSVIVARFPRRTSSADSWRRSCRARIDASASRPTSVPSSRHPAPGRLHFHLDES
jgi:hypothetical protein